MLRTRKKDINLKPNRILDKRSSRGMLYENEELRLRTIHINDEVDKGQNSIKKLKKENEHLKREIWGLRDECEKLEKMLKAVYRAIEESGSIEELGLSPEMRRCMLEFLPGLIGRRRRRTSFRRDSKLTEESVGDFEDDIDCEQAQQQDLEVSRDISWEVKPDKSAPQSASEVPFSESSSTVNVAEPPIFEIDSNQFGKKNPSGSTTPGSASPPLVPPIIEITPANGAKEYEISTENSTSIPMENQVTTQVSIEPNQSQSWVPAADSNVFRSASLQHRRNSGNKTADFLKLKTSQCHLFSKSVPNLSSGLFEYTYVNTKRPESASAHVPREEIRYEWDPNVLIGYIETGNGVSGKSSYKLTDFRVEEVIDELHLELGSDGLQQVTSVRLMGSNSPVTLFISFKSPDALRPLAEQGIMELRNGDIRIRLLEATKKCSLVHLFSLPPQIPDNIVIRVLNQYGQVVAPVERSTYKGVDISERLVKIYLCRKVPQTLNIGGYECPAKISSQGQLPPSSPKPDSLGTPGSVNSVLEGGSTGVKTSVFTFNQSPMSKVVQGIRNRAHTLSAPADAGFRLYNPLQNAENSVCNF